MTKYDLLTLYGRGRIGWKSIANSAYVICSFIRSLENTIRMVNGAKRSQQLEMPDFDELFEPNSSTVAKKDIFGGFMEQVDEGFEGFEDGTS